MRLLRLGSSGLAGRLERRVWRSWQWAVAERSLLARGARVNAIAANGGTISHHHGVGTDHAAWLPGEKGEVGFSLLRALKAELDPKGVLNPDKLLGPGRS